MLTKKSPITQAIWDKKIREARGFYYKGESHRLKVASIAIECCQVVRGARYNRFSIVNFAKGIGMNSKTLHHWISLKRNVADKVPASTIKSMSWDDCRAVMAKVNNSSTSREVIDAMNEVKNIPHSQKRIIKYIKVLKTISHNAMAPIKLMEFPDHYIVEMLKHVTLIKTFLEKELVHRKNNTSGAREQAKSQVNKFNGGMKALNE